MKDLKQRFLFIDRDGTLIEEPEDEQIDAFEKLKFTQGMFRNLGFLCRNTDFKLVMVSNQDGLGTDSFPENTFWPVHNFIIQTLEGEGITFEEQLIDRHFPEDHSPMRKPGTGMLTAYMDNPKVDMAGSYVIGDRESDRQLAANLGCKALILGKDGMTWDKIAEIVYGGERLAEVNRMTKETDIHVRLNLDGSGQCDIDTGLGFFDHMLEQIGKHGGMDLTIHTKGDLYVDEHHTIEDTALALGECLLKALGDKRGIERYGYCLPMDDCLCQVALDFGGRPWLIWDAEFHREKVGEMPTEMFLHFFKSLSDAAKINLNIKAEGTNEHHKIEGIFKALARSLKMAVKRDIYHSTCPALRACSKMSACRPRCHYQQVSTSLSVTRRLAHLGSPGYGKVADDFFHSAYLLTPKQEQHGSIVFNAVRMFHFHGHQRHDSCRHPPSREMGEQAL